MGLLNSTKDILEKVNIVPIYNENTTSSSIDSNDEGSIYILIPLGVLLGISILALLVYLMASSKRRLDYTLWKKRNRQRFLHEGNEYDSPLDQDKIEEKEDEVDNEDNPAESLLKGRLQINNRYENYLSTSRLNRSFDLLT